MDRKIVMGVAAVAGIGLLLYMRKSGDQATLAGTPISSGISNWASQPIVINATTKPQAVADTNTKSPAPTPMPPAKNPAAVPTFWDGGSAAAPVPTWNPTQNEWETKPGVAVDDNYTYGHLTPAQRGNKTDGQLTLSILGY